MNDSRNAQIETVVASFFCVLIVVVFFLRAPLTESFWLDETLSAWVVMAGAEEVWNRTIAFQGQSPLYYLLLWSWSKLFGSSEVALRFLSILFCGMALAFMARLAQRLQLPKIVTLIAISFLFSADIFQDALLSARPYSLALLIAVISIGLLVQLRGGFTARVAALWAASLVLVFYSHYLFGLIALPHFIVLLRSPILVRRVAPYLVGAGCCCIPGLVQVGMLFGRKNGLDFAATPVGLSLLRGWVPVATTVAVVMGAIVAAIWGGRISVGADYRKALRVLLPYVFLGPLPLRIVSVLGSASLWTPRYWSWQLMAMALVVGALTNSISGHKPRLIAITVIGSALLLRVASQERVVEGWREAAQLVAGRPGPVALYSGLIEVESGIVNGMPEYQQYLRSPLLVYGVTKEVRLMPIKATDEALMGDLRGVSSVVLQRRSDRSGAEISPRRFRGLLLANGQSIESEKESGTITWLAVR
jgi:hypothetical protein